MKRILIDLSQIPLQRTGVGIYAVHLLRQLQQADSGIEFHFLVLDDDAELLDLARAVPGSVVIPVTATLFRRLALRVLLEQVGIPIIALRHKIDAVHSLHYSFPMLSFGSFSRIVTVHDMSFFLFAEMHVPLKRHFFQFFIRRSARVEGMIFVSDSTRRDFEALVPGCLAHKAVIHHGADLAAFGSASAAGTFEALRDKYRLEEYILYVGTIEPRKNLEGLVQAFERVADAFPRLQLVIAGKLGWHYENLMGYLRTSPVSGRIIFTGYVSEAEKHALIRHSCVFAYVSRYEGFGIPIAEAMAAGVPVVTSNVSSMPEVAGDAALLVNPHDVDDIASALRALLVDEGLRRRLVGRGLAQCRRFTWERMTAETVQFYRRVLERKIH